MNENTISIEELRAENPGVYDEMPDWKVRRLIITIQHASELPARPGNGPGVYREATPLTETQS
jgi:hypothetical protein